MLRINAGFGSRRATCLQRGRAGDPAGGIGRDHTKINLTARNLERTAVERRRSRQSGDRMLADGVGTEQRPRRL